LALLVAASGAVLILWGSKLTFLLDDWEVLIYRPGFNAHVVLDPHGANIAVGLVLVYKALLALFGMGSALPFRVVSTAAFLLSTALLFALLRKRVGQWPALAGAAVVLFLGPAWEDLLWPFQIGYFGSMVGGLAMLLALERRRPRWDAFACFALTVSILFSSLGLPFLFAAAVDVLWDRDRLRRMYVVAVPFAVYVAWWLGWGHTAESALSPANAVHTPLFAGAGFSATFASAFGLVAISSRLAYVGLPLAIVAVVLIWRERRGLELGSKWLWVTIAGFASFWILAGLNQTAGRSPDASRYQYVSVVLGMLVAAELLRGVRVGRRALQVVLVVAVLAIASNIHNLHQGYFAYLQTSRLEKADLAALDIARETVEPGFVLEEDVALTAYDHIEAGPYFAAEDEFGTPAYDQVELADAPGPARRAADKVLAAALRIALVPVGGRAPAAPKATVAGDEIRVPAGRCVSAPQAGTQLFVLPPDGATIWAASKPVTDVGLRRYATSRRLPVDLEARIAAGRGAELRIPRDRSSVPWKLGLRGAGAATACGLAPAGK
jgi:hypothetical protein